MMNTKTGHDGVTYIAEFACIHEGDRDYLLQLASAVKGAGANAVKFQIFDPDEVVSPDHPDYAYLKSIAFSLNAWVDIIRACHDMGLAVWVDASGRFSLDVVEKAGNLVAGLKIHSADIGNPVVFEGVQRTGLPIAIGCGGTPLIDIFELLDAIGPEREIVLMHGYQAFPKLEGAKGGPPAQGVDTDDLALWRIGQFARTFPDARVGLSEHLAGTHPLAQLAPALAVAQGATVIEKHVTLDRAEQREDYFSSLEPAEFQSMVEITNAAAVAVGKQNLSLGLSETGYQREMKRGVRAAHPLKQQVAMTLNDVNLIRDGAYSCSARATRIFGRELDLDVAADEMLTEQHMARNVGIFCNARLASTRLPGKALLPFHGDLSTLGYLLTRLKSYPGEIGQIVLATTHLEEDDALARIADKVGVPSFRGEPEDVMGRMVQTANAFNWDVLVRVTGDDQLVSCEYIEKALRYHRENSLDYTRIAGLPIGMACEIIDVATLRRIHAGVTNLQQTEHLTWYLDSEWTCRNDVIEAAPEHQAEQFRVTLDYQEDYELMREVARRGHETQDDFYVTIDRLIEILRDINPAWTHHDELWTLKRAQVDVGLRYLWQSPAQG